MLLQWPRRRDGDKEESPAPLERPGERHQTEKES